MRTKVARHTEGFCKSSERTRAAEERLVRPGRKKPEDTILKADYPPLDLYFNAVNQHFGR